MKVYLDTSVISALFDERNPERKSLTEEFLKAIDRFEAFVSELTIAEIVQTPDESLRDRMREIASRFPVLDISADVEDLADKYMQHGAVPKSYSEDAYHIALAVTNRMDYLTSWNFKHLVRKKTRDIVRMVNTLHDQPHVEILTPAELL